MPLVKAQCVNCNAPLEVDNSKEAAICPHCGTPYIVEKAIHQFNTQNNTIINNPTFLTNSEIQNRLDSAKGYLKLGDIKSAQGVYVYVTNQYPHIFEGWWGVAKCEMMLNLANDAFLKGNYTSKYLDNSYKLASENDKVMISKELANYSQLVEKHNQNLELRMQKHFSTITNFKNYLIQNKIYLEGRAVWVNKPSAWDDDPLDSYSMFVDKKGRLVFGKEFNIFYNYYYLSDSWNSNRSFSCYKTKSSKSRFTPNQEFRLSLENICEDGSYIFMYYPYNNSNTLNKITMIEKKGEKKARGCYVATCVYGSYECPEVWVLRRYRDYILDSTWYGRLFIKCYYAISPVIVKLFGNQKWFKYFWKHNLDKLVKSCRAKGLDDTPYEDKY